MPLDEQALIQSAQAGDLAAFNQLVLIYQDQAYNVAYRLLNESDAAADAVQESFFKIYRRIHQYRGGSFRAWVLRIVTNSCYDSLRVSKRHYASRLDSDTVPPDRDRRLTDFRASPHDHAVRHELRHIARPRDLATAARATSRAGDVRHRGFRVSRGCRNDRGGPRHGQVPVEPRAQRCARTLTQKGFSPNVSASVATAGYRPVA